MSGLGGLNKSSKGVVIGLVQLQLPNVATPLDLTSQAERIAALVGKARRGSPAMDLVVFPEYSGSSCGFAEPTREYAGSEQATALGKISRVA